VVPSRNEIKIFLAEFHPWAEFRARSVAQAAADAWKFLSFACRRQSAAAWRLVYTNAVTSYNNCLMNIHAKIILFHFKRSSMLK